MTVGSRGIREDMPIYASVNASVIPSVMAGVYAGNYAGANASVQPHRKAYKTPFSTEGISEYLWLKNGLFEAFLHLQVLVLGTQVLDQRITP